MSSSAISCSLEQISSTHWCKSACDRDRGNDTDRNFRLESLPFPGWSRCVAADGIGEERLRVDEDERGIVDGCIGESGWSWKATRSRLMYKSMSGLLWTTISERNRPGRTCSLVEKPMGFNVEFIRNGVESTKYLSSAWHSIRTNGADDDTREDAPCFSGGRLWWAAGGREISNSSSW